MTNSSAQQEHAMRPDGWPPSGSLDDRFHHALVENLHPPAWRNPKFASEYDLVVIGAGPGGLTAARDAAALGAKVALIERDLIGGDRLNVVAKPMPISPGTCPPKFAASRISA
jgi:NADPH-dependent 2,4-dienoyl-CoA reductase/sulfur reductase-like enzyme